MYRFRTVVVEVARQNGKSLLLTVLALWHLFGLGSREVIGTAQDLTRSEASWADAVEWIENNDELEPYLLDVKRGHPKVLTVKDPDSGHSCVYRVAAASRRGARGFSGDLVLMDELREHQSWDSWSSVSNTMNARPRAQLWAFTNAGDASSVVLRYLRAAAHRSLGWPDGDGDKLLLGEPGEDDDDEQSVNMDVLGWFEWSAPLNVSRSDRQGWAQANPSLNHVEVVENCITERTLAGAFSTSPATEFEVECLCRWASVSDGGPFPSESWADTSDTASKVASGSASAVCLEIPADRSRAYLARATLDMAGKPVVGIWADQPGTDWVVPFLRRNRARYTTVVIRIGGGVPAASLANEVETAGLPWTKWNGVEVPAACGQMFDLLRDRSMRHLPHPALDTAATSAATKVHPDGGWVVDAAKSPGDTAPLTAAIGAVWGLGHLPDDRPSIYSGAEGADVLVL
ncbi:MAG: terminase [Mycobacteriaceae bacterium]